MSNEYGFIKPEITPEHYVFGDMKLGAVPIKIDGDWSDFVPLFESQNIGYETYSCTAFGTTNCIETLHKFLFKEEPNYSERYLADIVPIDPPGCDPQLLYEAIRKSGLVAQDKLPLPSSYADFITPRPMNSIYLDLGKQFLTTYTFAHDWVLTGSETKDDRLKKLKAGLQFSPLGISVTAWFFQNGVYVDNGIENNHWVMCYKIDDKGIYIYDSYEEDHKVLSLDHAVSYAKRITLAKKNSSEVEKLSLIQIIINLIKQVFSLQSQVIEHLTKPIPLDPISKSRELINLTLESIGKDISPKNLAPQEYSCAEGVSNLLSEIIPFPGSVLSTAQLKVTLDDCKYLERTTIPEPGCVIVSPRTVLINGHAGIFVDSKNIVSNDSKTGTMQKNYTLDEWIKEMKDNRGLHIYLWRFV